MPRASRPTPYATDPANAEVRRIRGALRLSKVDFARLLGCTRGNLYNLETGRQAVPMTMLRLARYLAHDANLVSVPPPVPPPDPTSVGMVLTPATTCDWREPRCRGPWWHMRASVNRLTHVECTLCDYHLPLVYRLLVQRLRGVRLPKDVPPPPAWPPAVRARHEEAVV